MNSDRRHRFITLAACALLVALAGLGVLAPNARAAAPSPKLLATMSPEARAAALQNYKRTFDRLHAQGVDRIYPQFALDMGKYPREGVAHRNLLVILCKFPAEGSSPAQAPASVTTPFYVYKHFFSDDPNDGLISLREYYRTNSRGRLVISGQTTSKWVDMPHSYDYYANGLAGLDFGSYPRSAQKLAEDAMVAAAQDFGGDLRYFDNDGPDGVPSSGDDDGYIDAVTVIVPGPGGETQCGDPNACNRLWAHESGIALYSNCPSGANAGPGCLPGFPVGGVRGFLYSIGSEFNEYPGDNAVGTWFHEFSHELGLPDLYDNVGGNGLGFFSLMALGNYVPYNADPNTAGGPLGSRPTNLDAWCRQFLGFDDPVPITAGGHYTLPPVSRQGGSRKIWTNGDVGTEYYLVENRIREGSDRFLPGEGMVVYHVDDTKVDNIAGYPNYRVAVVQADSVNPLQLEFGANYGDPRDFFPGSLLKRSLTDATQPDSRSWAGLDTGIRIWNIAGKSDGADTASFDLNISTQPDLRPAGYTIDDNGGDGYADENETDHLFLTVKNVGLASSGLHLSLSTTDPVVTITNALVNPAPLATGASEVTPVPFIFAIGAIATLPHDIVFTVDWTDDGGAAGTFDITLTAGMASGLFEDFESGAEPGLFWNTVSLPGSVADEWHASTSRARGTESAKLGSSLALGSGSNESQTYASFQDAALVSPAFDLPPNSELVFYSYIDAETYGGEYCFDGGRVEISMAGGEWVPLAVDGGYGSQMRFDSEANLRGADVFSGSPQSWRKVTCDLSGYAGAARIRFRFASDYGNAPFDNLARQVRYYEGWYVDDVLVGVRSVTGPTPRPLSFRAGPNPYRVGGPSAGSIVFRFSAPDGLPHPELVPDVRVFDVHGRLVRSLQGSPSNA
ncbi:MAG: M6 family metalloprotease domain-containing protein, partial [Candidatus Eiseniibacteriota bacterium]